VPLVAVQRFGRGRAMIFGGEGSWRWKMMMPAADGTYDAFWRQAARWLASEAPEPLVAAVPSAVALGRPATVDISVRTASFEPVPDASLHVVVRDPAGVAREIAASPVETAAGRHGATFVPEEAGLYRVTVEARRGDAVLGTVEQPLLVGALDPELIDPRLNETVLRQIAEGSRGRYVRAGEAGGVASTLRSRRVPPRRSDVRDLWHNAWSFLAVVLLLGTEWALRRAWGLR
jgi:hypothetical protein